MYMTGKDKATQRRLVLQAVCGLLMVGLNLMQRYGAFSPTNLDVVARRPEEGKVELPFDHTVFGAIAYAAGGGSTPWHPLNLALNPELV